MIWNSSTCRFMQMSYFREILIKLSLAYNNIACRLKLSVIHVCSFNGYKVMQIGLLKDLFHITAIKRWWCGETPYIEIKSALTNNRPNTAIFGVRCVVWSRKKKRKQGNSPQDNYLALRQLAPNLEDNSSHFVILHYVRKYAGKTEL